MNLQQYQTIQTLLICTLNANSQVTNETTRRTRRCSIPHSGVNAQTTRKLDLVIIINLIDSGVRCLFDERVLVGRDFPSPYSINCLSGGATLVDPDRPAAKEELHRIKSLWGVNNANR